MRASRFAIARVAFVVLIATFALELPAARAINIEFSAYSNGDLFPNSSLPLTLVTDGSSVELTEYNGSNGANASIWDIFPMGVEPNALFLAADIRAEVLLPAPSTGGLFFFHDFGGTNYLEINGALLDFTDSSLTGLDFNVVGGVSVHSDAAGDLGARSVKLEGPITSIAFIGQELLIDRIELTLVPEPASWITLALGACALLALRRSKKTRRLPPAW